jgi:hypothetical protein
VTALTAIGTSDSARLRRVAVMMMSPAVAGCCCTPCLCTAAPSVALLGCCAVCLSVSVVDCEVGWASAGVATAKTPAESSHADLRIIMCLPSMRRLPSKRVEEKRLRSRNDNKAARLKQFGNSNVSSASRLPA